MVLLLRQMLLCKPTLKVLLLCKLAMLLCKPTLKVLLLLLCKLAVLLLCKLAELLLGGGRRLGTRG
jgi:hypothetical protein